MKNILVFCDQEMPKELDKSDVHDVLSINHYPPNKNIRIGIENVTHSILKNPNPLTLDLLDIAAYIYHADSSIRRGTNKDTFHENWVRTFKFNIPVRELDIWQQEEIKELLTETLEFLTEDRFEFDFTQRAPELEQLIIKEVTDELPFAPKADCVILFSGGMDSLCGAVDLYTNGRKPILVSHKSRNPLAHLQLELAKEIRNSNKDWSFPHIHAWVQRIGERAVEDSQRSRSFLFLALGTLVAFELQIEELFVYENGITTFNLPRSSQTLGAFASRSTHPKVIGKFQAFIKHAFKFDIQIINPFIWKTRAEVLHSLKKEKCEHLLPFSISCNHSRQTKIHPNCGTCSQCIDRRFAVHFANADTPNELQTYGANLFTDPIEQNEKKAQAIGPYQFSLKLRKMSQDDFMTEYVQIFDALDYLESDFDSSVANIFKLYKRYADEVFEVIKQFHNEYFEQIHNQELPSDCLLMITRPTDSKQPDWRIIEEGINLSNKLNTLEPSQGPPFELLVEDILTFLFCKNTPVGEALEKPDSQSNTDQGFERRDLVFRNNSQNGLWADIRREFNAYGIIVDAKNYKDELDGDTVSGFAHKYLKSKGLGQFGILIGRQIPEDIRQTVSQQDRESSTLKRQKDLWKDDDKMVIILGDKDLKKMIHLKNEGKQPTEIINNHIYNLKSRI